MHSQLSSTRQARHVIFFSGGICSYLAAKRAIREAPAAETLLLFCNTMMEDEDLYRFLKESAKRLDRRLITIADGRTPWEVFSDNKMLGNPFIDPCSRVLKRALARRWIEQHCDPHATTLYLGLSYYEEHRIKKNQAAWKPWRTEYPMCQRPLLDQCEMIAEVAGDGLRPPRLYELGFPHNNCGGFCVKAGHAHFRHLLKVLPERYRQHEEQELQLRNLLRKPVTILRDNTARGRRPITLAEFRERCESGEPPARDEEWGGCACMLDPAPDEIPA